MLIPFAPVGFVTVKTYILQETIGGHHVNESRTQIQSITKNNSLTVTRFWRLVALDMAL